MSSKQKMIDQSYNLFCEHGENFSLSQVTNVLGIKKQSIYNYFSGKDELIIEMLKYKINGYFSDSKDAYVKIADANLKEKLYAIGEFTISAFESEQRLKFRKWLSLSMSTKGISEIKDVVKSNDSKFRECIGKLIQDGKDDEVIKNDDIDFIVTAYIVLIRGIVDGILSIENYEYSQAFFKRMFEKYWLMITSEL